MIGQQSAQDKGLGWRCEIPGDLPRVWGDRTRLRQVALNLIHNAIKFTTSGSIDVWAVADDNNIMISVKDTGIGIPAEMQQKIFEEFTTGAKNKQRQPSYSHTLAIESVTYVYESIVFHFRKYANVCTWISTPGVGSLSKSLLKHFVSDTAKRKLIQPV